MNEIEIRLECLKDKYQTLSELESQFARNSQSKFRSSISRKMRETLKEIEALTPHLVRDENIKNEGIVDVGGFITEQVDLYAEALIKAEKEVVAKMGKESSVAAAYLSFNRFKNARSATKQSMDDHYLYFKNHLLLAVKDDAK